MLVTFTCRAYADITMFGNVATQLLKIMGYSNPQQGAILADKVPQALARLKQGMGDVKTPPDAIPQRHEEEERPVSLTHRALPLIELLAAAKKDNCDVMWNSH